MMKFGNDRKEKDGSLYLLAIIVAIIYFFSLNSSRKTVSEYGKMHRAAKRMKEISVAIYDEKLRRGIEINPELDINKTGFIGEEFTGITTTLGNLESKRTGTNPDFAAFFVKLLVEKKIKEGDKVAVNFSGSFPALNIALIVALEEVGVEPIIISSIGASTYGANNEKFNYLHMENFLLEEEFISTQSEFFSLGGDWDRGINFDEEIRDNILREINLSDGVNKTSFIKNRKFIYNEDPKISLNKKLGVFEEMEDIKFFANVGGNYHSSELLEYFEKKGVPTISLLNIKEIALQHGIPIDPSPFPEIGKGDIYHFENKLYYDIAIFLITLLYMIGKILVTRK